VAEPGDPERHSSGSSGRVGVLLATLASLLGYVLAAVDDGAPAVAGKGVLASAGDVIVAGTVVLGLLLTARPRTRRLGLGMLVGSVVAFVLAAAALFVLILYVASEVGA
jgi:hypothetical protein